MPVNSAGIFTLPYNWEEDKLQNIKIRSDRMMGQENDIADAINLQVDRAGKKSMQANLNMGLNKIANLATGTASADAVNKSQLDTQVANINAKTATTSVKGFVQLATLDETIAGAIETKAVTPYGFKNALSVINSQLATLSIQRESIYGFDVSGTIGGTNLTVQAGGVYDNTGTQPIIMKDPTTKAFNSTWTAGTAGGLRPSGLAGLTGQVYLFAIAKPSTNATAGTLTTVSLTSKLAALIAVSNGSLHLEIDNIDHEFTSINLTSATTLSQVAEALNLSVNLYATAELVGSTIVFTSRTTGLTSKVHAEVSTSGGTDLYGSSYLDLANAVVEDGLDADSGTADIGCDSDINAANLMADTNVVAGGYIYVQRIGVTKLSASSELQYAWLSYSLFGRLEVGAKIYSDDDFVDGALYCDGSEKSKAIYARLFLKIGTKYGAGNGTTTFNIPDWRGNFTRGYGGKSGAIGVQQLNAAPLLDGGSTSKWKFINQERLGNDLSPLEFYQVGTTALASGGCHKFFPIRYCIAELTVVNGTATVFVFIVISTPSAPFGAVSVNPPRIHLYLTFAPLYVPSLTSPITTVSFTTHGLYT